MGHILILIESPAVTLLAVALVLACVARLRRPWLREALWIPVALVLLLVYLGLTVFAGVTWWSQAANSSKIIWWPVGRWFHALLALTVCYVVGVVWLRVRALRLVDGDPSVPAATSWPRGKLAIALTVAFALHAMTFWNLDLAIRQQLAVARAEAGALALSVAPARLPDRDNAALVYMQAFEAMGIENDTWPKQWDEWRTGIEQGTLDPNDPVLSDFLRRQTPALILLREASDKPGCYFDRDYGRPGIDMLLPYLQPMRCAARLLAVDARVKAAGGDIGGALSDVNAMFAIAEHVGSDSILVSTLVAAAIDATASDTLSVVLVSGEASEQDLAQLHVDPSLSYRRMFERSIRMEEAFGLLIFCDAATGRVSLESIGGSPATGRGSPWQGARTSLYCVFLMADDMATHQRFMREFRLLAAKPYYEAKEDWERFSTEVGSGPGGILTALMLPALKRCAIVATEAEARRRVARLTVAMHRYRAAEGRFPEKLEELAPESIAFIPVDPFDGKPMKLKRIERGPVIYSIGPDMKDGDGAPFDRKEKTGDIIFQLLQ